MDDLEETNEETELQHMLTEWANEPTLTDLKQNYKDASIEHDAQVKKIDYWLDHLNTRGQARLTKKKGRSNVHPKVIRKQAEWRYPSLTEPFLSTHDLFDATPRTHLDRDAAEQNGLVLNYQFNTQLDKVGFFNECIRTSVDEGTAIIRIGWEFEEKEVPGRKLAPTDDPNILMAYQAFQQDPNQLQMAPPELQAAFQASMEAGQPLMWQEAMVKETVLNQPTLDVCDYRNVVPDPTCEGNLDKAQFIIYMFETTLSDLQKSSINYANLDKIDVESASANASTDGSDEVEEQNFRFNDKPRKKIIAYEYWGFWDINDTGKTEPFVATWVDNTLIRMEENPFPDKKLPFVSVQHLPVRKKIYGEPDGELLIENQQIIGATLRGMNDIMGRSGNGQQGYRRDALDYTNEVKFQRGEDYVFNPGVDPRQAFHMHTFPEIPQSAGLMLQLQQTDAESLTGVKAFSTGSGISSEALGKVATGIRSAMDATSKRELDILRRLAKCVIEIGRKITSMNAVFLSEEEVIRLTDEEFVTVKREDLSGKIDVKLTISTAEADNEKARELAFMLQTIGPNADPGEVRIIRAEIARLRDMPDLAKRIEEYQPEPDPFAEEMKRLEMEKLKAEIEKIKSEALENQMEAQLDAADARKKEAEADLTDLNFLEQESGASHNRDLQKISKQAEEQTQMKIVEGLLKKDENAQKTLATNR